MSDNPAALGGERRLTDLENHLVYELRACDGKPSAEAARQRLETFYTFKADALAARVALAEAEARCARLTQAVRDKLTEWQCDIDGCFVCGGGAKPRVRNDRGFPCEKCMEKARAIGDIEGTLDRVAALRPAAERPGERTQGGSR